MITMIARFLLWAGRKVSRTGKVWAHMAAVNPAKVGKYYVHDSEVYMITAIGPRGGVIGFRVPSGDKVKLRQHKKKYEIIGVDTSSSPDRSIGPVERAADGELHATNKEGARSCVASSRGASLSRPRKPPTLSARL